MIRYLPEFCGFFAVLLVMAVVLCGCVSVEAGTVSGNDIVEDADTGMEGAPLGGDGLEGGGDDGGFEEDIADAGQDLHMDSVPADGVGLMLDELALLNRQVFVLCILLCICGGFLLASLVMEWYTR